MYKILFAFNFQQIWKIQRKIVETNKRRKKKRAIFITTNDQKIYWVKHTHIYLYKEKKWQYK